MPTVTYRYSKINSTLFVVLCAGMIGISIPNLIHFVNIQNSTNWELILVFDFAFAVMLLYMMVKQFIPAMQGKIALEINPIGIISYVKNINIEWKDIKDVDFRTGKSSSSLYITFKYETDRGDHVRIPLAFIAGNDSKIYNTVKEYLNRS